jgi:toxin-antitoxin system PIN domain toxin
MTALMPDVNVLVYAHRQDESRNAAYRAWLEAAIDGPTPFALSVLVAVGFVRVVTNPCIYHDPTPLSVALAVVERLMAHPRCRVISPGIGHLEEVSRLCRAVDATGKHVADAQHAAVAIAEGATWVSRDSDFARFEHHGLHWQHLVIE